MKKLVMVLFLILFSISNLWAAAAGTGAVGTTLLNAVTSTGVGTGVMLPSSSLGGMPSIYTCVVTWGGTAPTNTVVAVEGSLNNTSYYALATVTVTASPTMFHISSKPVKYIRGNYVSRSVGDGTTSVTLVCAPGGF